MDLESKKTRHLDFLAIAISLSALFLSFWQAYQTVRHNELTYTPFVRVQSSFSKTERGYVLRIDMINSGLGPAALHTNHMEFICKPTPNPDFWIDLGPFINEKYEANNGLVKYLTPIPKYYVLEAGKSKSIIALEFKSFTDLSRVLSSLSKSKCGYSIDVNSIYEENYTYRGLITFEY